jgi:hypothetical protein
VSECPCTPPHGRCAPACTWLECVFCCCPVCVRDEGYRWRCGWRGNSGRRSCHSHCSHPSASDEPPSCGDPARKRCCAVVCVGGFLLEAVGPLGQGREQPCCMSCFSGGRLSHTCVALCFDVLFVCVCYHSGTSGSPSTLAWDTAKDSLGAPIPTSAATFTGSLPAVATAPPSATRTVAAPVSVVGGPASTPYPAWGGGPGLAKTPGSLLAELKATTGVNPVCVCFFVSLPAYLHSNKVLGGGGGHVFPGRF